MGFQLNFPSVKGKCETLFTFTTPLRTFSTPTGVVARLGKTGEVPNKLELNRSPDDFIIAARRLNLMDAVCGRRIWGGRCVMRRLLRVVVSICFLGSYNIVVWIMNRFYDVLMHYCVYALIDVIKY